MAISDDGERPSVHGALGEDDLSLDATHTALLTQMQSAYRTASLQKLEGAATTDAEISAVVATIARLADGNCATKTDVRLTHGHAETRAVRLEMKVAISWGSTNKALPGNHAINGSRACERFADIQAYLQEVCSAACRDPAAAKRVTDHIATAPVSAMDNLLDGYRIGPLPYTAHLVEECEDCNGAGMVRCKQYNCRNGKVDCPDCNHTGKSVCYRCHGTQNETLSDNRMISCRQCNGSGRHGICQRCYGAQQITCYMCSGTGQVGCKPCERTGCFTRVYNSHLQGSVSRSLSFDEDAPQGFRLSCQAVAPLTALTQTPGVLVRPEISSADGRVQLVLHCQTRHVHVEVDCKGTGVVIDALGAKHTIPLMPPFLDKVMAGLINDIRAKATSHPVQALTQAATARVTRDILGVVGAGKGAKAILTASPWGGAISEGRITDIHGWLKTAYSKAARSSVRRAWFLLSPLIGAGAVLTNVFRLPIWVLHLMEHVTGVPSPSMRLPMGLACELIATLPVVACAWLVAGRVGRRRLRAGVGTLAQRSPRQGMWPVLGLVLATAAGWGSALLKLDGLAVSQHRVPGTRGSEQPMDQAFPVNPTANPSASGEFRPPAGGTPSASNVGPQAHPRHSP